MKHGSLLKFWFPGALAQLGERLHGMQEVVSSNLIGSIEFETANLTNVGFAVFRLVLKDDTHLTLGTVKTQAIAMFLLIDQNPILVPFRFLL